MLLKCNSTFIAQKLIATEIKSKQKESQQKVKLSINQSQPQLQTRLNVVI